MVNYLYKYKKVIITEKGNNLVYMNKQKSYVKEQTQFIHELNDKKLKTFVNGYQNLKERKKLL